MGSSAETGIPHLETENLYGDQKKRARNPLIPIGALLTAGFVQKLMRARVVVQVATMGENYSGILTSPGI
ncbi:hypothetical protein AMTRI_Chr01g111660 [Amborella trichopoda]